MHLANTLNTPLALAFHTNDPTQKARYLDQAFSALQYKSPRLHSYLFCPVEQGGLALGPGEVFGGMFRGLLTNGLDVERLVRVWDCFVFEGDRVVTRAAVAVLGCLQAQIFAVEGGEGREGSGQGKREAVVEMLGWGPGGRESDGFYWNVGGDVEKFMEEVREAGKVNYPS